ncbi:MULTISPECIES: spore cortex biosynthesis protein YabQ [Bacillus]|uniref:spore cortex biosynthesis protein YabQ n=1 Tax=Bacillus TaxID=1386 RepID=UPI0007631E14|nr:MULTISPECIES: spore cortex biosynthesis protein YabQ [Bacillus]MCA1020388.1 spore cortex biosynthesis protein YabQ [Bacillus stratosphericus]AMB88447.1 spore coat protein [Bacillus altitudinis]MCA0121044.1 spore cortex biosynthesis protein YabQ [Bacillus sp. RSS_NA_20]MCY7497185.1 spore cortex biosynthesis protein YabQ [Bacillus altitudinis]MCY7537459.1 spore cortex biosynthesis protein YabQ [Bacillus altitudinis]
MTLTVQFYTMLSMAAMGIWLGASLDTYKLFVNREKTAKWLLVIHDLLFWVVQGLLFFYVLLLTNEGEFRLYIFLAVALGFSMYQALMKQLYMNILKFVMRCIYQTVLFLKRLIMSMVFQPIRWIVGLIISVLLFLFHSLLRLVRFAFRLVWKVLYIVCYPLIWLLNVTIIHRIPEKWRTSMRLFFSKGAGILQGIKKLSRTMKTKWKQFWTK